MKETPDPFMVYLAGPIDDTDPGPVDRWRQSVAETMPPLVACYNPSTAYLNGGPETAKAVCYMNRHAISCCDGMIANLAVKGRALGTIREIEFSVSHNKPVVVICDVDATSMHLMMHDVSLVWTFDQAVTEILKQMAKRRHVPPGIALMLGIQYSDEDPDE